MTAPCVSAGDEKIYVKTLCLRRSSKREEEWRMFYLLLLKSLLQAGAVLWSLHVGHELKILDFDVI